jgi:hypothetical protein
MAGAFQYFYNLHSKFHVTMSHILLFYILFIVQSAVGRKGEWCKLELVGYWGLCVVYMKRFVILITCTENSMSQSPTAVSCDIQYIAECATRRKGE